MKKLFLSICCGLVALGASAEKVGERQAAKMAADIFGAKSGKSASMTLVKTGYQKAAITPLAVSKDPTYFVYDRQGGGWIILSAEDNVETVLAWSDEGSFPVNNTPSNLSWWLDSVISGEIAYAKSTGTVYVPKQDLPKMAGAQKLLLETAQWDQSAPYNNLVPQINGHKPVTGCVATAAAIKCRYHRWPYRGSGTTPAYTYYCDDAKKNVTMDANTLGHAYDYDNMLLSYSGSTTSAQKEAVATLMRDLGLATKMMYGWSSSGAYTSDMAAALKKYFHYSQDLKLVNKSGDETTWSQKLEAEMEANGPILYSGVDPDPNGGGHAFVFAGYTEDHYFYVNWGWSSSGNGWFKTSSLGNTSTGVYSKYQDAMFNAAPDKSGIYTPDEVAGMTSLKYADKTLTFSCEMKYDIIISKDGQTLKSSLNNAAGSELAIPCSQLGASGTYSVTVRLSEYYVEFPDSQYSFEIEY